jgi:hypothetical protein
MMALCVGRCVYAAQRWVCARSYLCSDFIFSKWLAVRRRVVIAVGADCFDDDNNCWCGE